MSLKDKYAFIGLGLTRQGKVPDMNTDELAAQAISRAIQDAGINKADIDGYIYQQGIGGGQNGTTPLHMVGVPGHFCWEVQSMGNYAIAMVAMAIGAMEAGLCHTCILLHATSASSRRVLVGAAGPAERSNPGAYGWYGPGGTAACMASRFMHLYGLTRQQLGSVSLTLREYASKRPEAVMYDKKITMDDYLNARMIIEPLCLYDFCLVNDGAVALIITSAERAKNYKKPPVYVMGYGVDHSLRELSRSPQAMYHFEGFVTQKAGEHALDMAGIKLKDVDVGELYDAFTIFLLSQLESYGICGRGEAGAFVEAGNLKLNGAFPSNTSGTELSWSYLSGFSHLTEGIRQMRGESGECQVKDAEICMVTGLGGVYNGGSNASCCILRR
jgi:acetyl-CoA acetyltransferase